MVTVSEHVFTFLTLQLTKQFTIYKDAEKENKTQACNN